MKKKLLNDQVLVHFLKRYLFFAVLFFTIGVWGQVSITSLPQTYSQDFNGLSTTATTFTNNTTLTGWYISSGTLPVSDGNANSNSCYNYGTSSASDRSIGALSTSTTHNFGVRIKNNSTVAIASFDIAFNGEQWRQNSTAQTLVFEYQISSSAITSLTSGTWTAASSFDYTGINTGTAGPLDGNLTANRTAKSGTLTVNVPAGSEIFLRWTKSGSSSPGLAIDDLSITARAAGITSAQTGNWADGTTWVGGVAPTSSQNAVIASGHIVTVASAVTRNSGTSTTVTGTLAAAATYTNDGTTTINGTFQINAGGYANGTTNLTYGTAGTLVFNHSNSTDYGVSGGSYWPITNGPVNVTLNANSPISLGFARTVTGVFATSAALTGASNLTVNGTNQINSTSASFDSAVNYGASSTLVYNSGSTFNRGNEWNNSPTNVTLQNSTTLNYPNGWGAITRTLNGNLNVGTGSALYMDYGSPSTGVGVLTVKGNVLGNGNISLGNQPGGDLVVGGNFTNTATFNANGRKVTFNGSAGQSITGATSFAYLEYNSTSGTNVLTINNDITVSNELRFTTGLVSLASGVNVNIANNASIVATSGNFNSASTNGTINFLGTGTTTGTINFYPSVAQTPSGLLGVSYSTGTTIQNVLTLNSNSYVASAPKYATGSTLVYNNTGTYARGVEWGSVGTTFPANGYPHNVTIQNGTALNIETGLTGTLRANGNLNLGVATSAGSLNMQNTGNALEIKGNVNLGNSTGTSTLTLSTNVGGDLSVAGNWVKNATNGVLVNNNRAVAFNGTSAQTLTGATTFDYLTINNSAGLTLNNAVNVNQTLNLTSGKITIGNNDLTIASTGNINGNSNSSYVVTLGTGQLKRTVGPSATVFPVGSASAYNPITFTNAGTSDVFGVILTSGTVPNVQDATSTVNDRWLVSEATAGGSTLTVVPQWSTSDQGINFASGNQTYVGFYNGTSWTQNAATVSGSNPYTATGASAFSPSVLSGTQYFAIGKDNAFICGTTPIAYSQGFNSTTIPTCWSTTIIPTSTQTGTKISFVTSSTNPSPGLQEGTHFVRYNSYSNGNGGAGSEERLGSNPLSSIGIASVDVEFYMYNDSGYSDKLTEGIQVQYSLDGTNWTDVSGAYFQRYATSNAWNLKKITLPVACANATKFYVGFKFRSEYGNNIYLDNVVVKQSPPTLFVNGTSSATLSFGTNDIGSTVTAQTFSLSGANLTGAPSNVTLTVPSDFQISSDAGTTWGSSVTVPYATSTLASHDISVKYIPTTCGNASSGTITFSGGGVSTYPVVSLSGTAVLAKPVTNETDITATTFTANWSAVSGASGYELDVYRKTETNKTFFENFETGLPTGYTSGTATLGTGVWSGARFIKGSTQPNSGSSVLQLENSSNSYLQTPALENISSISFWMAGSNAAVSLKVQYSYDDVNWLPVDATTPTYYGAVTKQLFTVNLAAPIPGLAKIRFLRFGSAVYIDDVTINYTETTYDHVSNYNPYVISGGAVVSQLVTGLTPNTQYYYKVRATQGSCKSIDSDERSVTTNNIVIWTNNAWTNGRGPTANLDAIVRDNYSTSSTGSFTAKDLTVEDTGKVTIGSGDYVKVEGILTVNNNVAKDNFVILTGGNLLQTSTATNDVNGIIQAQRSVADINNDLNTAMDYVYWSSPVSGQATTGSTGFSPGTPANRFYEYNESKDTFKATMDGTFVAGKGYAVRAETGLNPETNANYIDGYSKIYKFNGVPNNGDININLIRTNTTGNTGIGFNLVGNPYPSNMDFRELYAANSSVIYNTAYFWTNNVFVKTQAGTGYAQNNYAVYNGTGGNAATQAAGGSGDTTVPDGLVSIGQGFIVQAKNQGTSSLSFKNSYSAGHDLRLAGTSHFYQKQSSEAKNRFWIKLKTPNDLVNTQLIGYMSGASNEFEQDYDAETLSTSSDVFYSILGSRQLLIQGRSENFTTNDVVPVGANFYQDGTYSIGLDRIEGIFENGQRIYLKDNLLNKVVDLSQGDYNFSASKGLNNTRFEIVYKGNEVLGVDGLSKSDFTVYRDGEVYVVHSTKKLGKVEVYDVSGRMLRSFNSAETIMKIDMSDVSNGIYIIKVENSGDTKTKKIIK
ncbi:MAG: T9SS type A sorting domain-containing protein [Chryseobacterium sp.]|nr:T9SS type A sorting domain-containing protein [Chryseobacterium sp.]